MSWQLSKEGSKETQDREKRIEEECLKKNKPLPDWLIEKRKNTPKLAMWVDFYYQSFCELCTERPNGESVASIPWSKIQLYADHYKLSFSESERFHYIIRKVDDLFIERMQENAKKQLQSIEPGKANKK